MHAAVLSVHFTTDCLSFHFYMFCSFLQGKVLKLKKKNMCQYQNLKIVFAKCLALKYVSKYVMHCHGRGSQMMNHTDFSRPDFFSRCTGR